MRADSVVADQGEIKLLKRGAVQYTLPKSRAWPGRVPNCGLRVLEPLTMSRMH